jgi:tol-pal system protein YbgF
LLSGIETRVGSTEREVQDKRAILELSATISELRQEMMRLRGQIEVLGNQVEQSDRRGRDLYNDLDGRMRRFEQARVEQSKAAEDAEARKRAEEAKLTELAANESKVYEAALNAFKLGNYGVAIQQFQGFTTQYPNSKLAPSAQYWLGNSHYALRDYKSAITAQQRVVSTWPDDAKAPDALLNIASSLADMGDANGARTTLRSVVERYPRSPAAEQAKQRLARPR